MKILNIYTQVKEALEAGKSARTVSVDEKDQHYINELMLLTAKPILYLCNVDEASAKDGNANVESIKEAVKDEDAEVLVIAAGIEAEITMLDTQEDRLEFLAEMGLKEPGVNKLIRSAYRLLNLQTYFTAGVKEVRAWTITKGMSAPQAAGVIHTDFEKGFIRAEVIKYDDFVELRSESACRDAGKLGVEGKDYVLDDGDIMHFRFNV
ncbi:MAG: redox-regulated ATPase YchF [Flavobacteriales bacterium]|nr:redox-regulated ATPase YchF [Flavobacteriales bacterium]